MVVGYSGVLYSFCKETLFLSRKKEKIYYFNIEMKKVQGVRFSIQSVRSLFDFLG